MSTWAITRVSWGSGRAIGIFYALSLPLSSPIPSSLQNHLLAGAMSTLEFTTPTSNWGHRAVKRRVIKSGPPHVRLFEPHLNGPKPLKGLHYLCPSSALAGQGRPQKLIEKILFLVFSILSNFIVYKNNKRKFLISSPEKKKKKKLSNHA